MNQTTIKLNSKSLNVPKEFFDVGVKATFDTNPQANITTDEFTFNLDAYQEILEWIENGKKSGVGIFEGMPIQINANSGNNSINAFNGILDFVAGFQSFPNLGEVKVKLRQDNGLNQLADLIEPLDYGYLKELGIYTQADYSDVDYNVVKIDITPEALAIVVTSYLLFKQIFDFAFDTTKEAATTGGIAASGIPGPVGAGVYAGITIAAKLIYLGAILALLLNLGIELFNLIVQPKRTHKCISYRKLIEKVCNYIGYNFNTTITDLDSIHYLASNNNVDDREGTLFIKKYKTITEGIPHVTDYGYACPEMFQLVRDMFNARFAILKGTVEFHSENSDFWVKESSYIKPDAIAEQAGKSFRFNTEDMKSSRLISFQTDIADAYTIKNYTGTVYQILTDAITINVEKNKTIKNADQINLPVALGNRKDSLNGLEKGLLVFAEIFDSVGKLFGGNPNLAKRIKSKEGILKVAQNNHTVPKAIWLVGKKLPANHRDLLSAKALYNNYHIEKSFVSNNFSRQRRVIETERIPFGFDAFEKLINNSYFYDIEGKLGKATELEWVMNRDYAIISYWQPEIYTKNLKETFIEP